MHKAIRILLTGGGTGGHIYPNFAVLNYLKSAGFAGEVLYVGSHGQLDRTIIEKEKIPFKAVHAVAFMNIPKAKKILNLFFLVYSVFESLRILVKFKPHLIIASGGYVSAPVVFAAALLKPFSRHKTIIHEQNIMPGKMNKIASQFADLNFVSFEESPYFLSSSKCIYAGYPTRNQRFKGDARSLRESLGIDPGKRVVLIIGGSLGARTINNVTAGCIPDLLSLSESHDFLVIHSIGLNKSKPYNAWDATRALLNSYTPDSGKPGEEKDLVEIRNKSGDVIYLGYPYIDNMPEYLAIADVIVSRAGAGGLFETMKSGKASMIIPKRDLPGNHQELNAISFGNKGACTVVFEDSIQNKDFIDPDVFFRELKKLICDTDYRDRISSATSTLDFPDTGRIMVESIEKLIMHKTSFNFIEDVTIPGFVQFQNQFDNLVSYLDKIYTQNKEGIADNLYFNLYNRKIGSYLQHSNYLERNKGVKLIGVCRRTDLYKYLVEKYDTEKGFIRRNSLIALQKAPVYEPFFLEIILKGIKDSYFESKREALALALKWAFDMERSDIVKLQEYLVPYARFKRLNFEAKIEALKLILHIFDEQTLVYYYIKAIQSSNIKVRQGTLDALVYGHEHHLLPPGFNYKVILDKLVLSSTEFAPVFPIKESYKVLVDLISKEIK
ncbi:MAG: UDP-N-acetylglucosamine--N-acetylmuramyl-(pentapeptide) pyrophosphoryl-undecaprenol N-acetylglucosamine transferase [Bacteroidales bacterium]